MAERKDIVVIGSLNADLVQKVERLPRPGETLTGHSLETYSGGKGANQACAAARMGASVAMVGQVGHDSLGSLLVESLRSAGVDTRRVGLADRPTGTAVILVLPDGENLIVISPGANATVTPDLAATALADLEPGSFLLCQLEIPLESVERSLALAKTRQVITILDPAPAHELPRELLRHVDFLTPNETEALMLLGRPDGSLEGDAEAREVACQLLSLGVRTVVLKLGSRGCLVANVESSERVPGFKVAAVDTTAAGDTFNGAFATALAEGRSVVEAARFANAAGALSVTKPGAQNSVPTRGEVEQLFNHTAA